MPSIFADAEAILDTCKWDPEEFYRIINGKKECTLVFEDELQALIDNVAIRKQIECQGVDVGAVVMEWVNLKKTMLTWNNRMTKCIPLESWAQIGVWVKCENFANLFSLVDFFLCHNLSSADAERGFSVMKEIKTSKRSKIENVLLTLQLGINIDGMPITEFDPTESIDCWLLRPTTCNKSGITRMKPPSYMDTQTEKHGPKKKKHVTPIFINDDE